MRAGIKNQNEAKQTKFIMYNQNDVLKSKFIMQNQNEARQN